jgi:uncharacterized membrane protein YbaN (DUF454 family)
MNTMQPVPGSRSRRALFVSLGSLCVGLGAAGVVVPGLPTTVFLLAASYLFARSSPRLHRRLLAHRVFGPYLRRFMEQRAMPRRAKVAALSSMWGGIALSWLVSAAMPAILLATLALGLTGSAVLLFWVRTSQAVA